MFLQNRKISKSAFKLIKQAKINSYKKELIEQAEFEFELLRKERIELIESADIWSVPEYSELADIIEDINNTDFTIELPTEFIAVKIEFIRVLDIIKSKFKSATDRTRNNLIELLLLFRHSAEIRTYIILA